MAAGSAEGLEVEWGIPAGPPPGDAPPVSLVVGSFDGVHLGHRSLIDRAVAAARTEAGETAVLTFDPHPRCVLAPSRCPPSLTTLQEKRDLLSRTGADRLVVVPFTVELSRWSAEAFCDALAAGFRLSRLLAGPGFALGHRRAGDMSFLRDWGEPRGIEVVEVPPVTVDGRTASSTQVREDLAAGRLAEATRMLGHHHLLDGRVEPGRRLGGDLLGLPSANVAVPPGKCLPEAGVYACWLRLRGRWYAAATNVGYRPTLETAQHLRVDAHILDFDGEIYGEAVRLAFVARLRDELTLPSTEELAVRIAADVEATRSLLAGTPAPDLV